MIRSVVFDIGDVICQWDPRVWLQHRFGEKLGPRMLEIVMGSTLWKEKVDRGTMPEEVFFRLRREEYPELAAEIAAVEEEWKEILPPKQDTEDLIRRLKAAGYGVYYLSNFPEKTFCYVWERTPASRLMDGGVVSWRERLVKPEPAIYRLLLDRYGLRGEETVFTDDTPVNVEGARAAGLFAWHFTGAAGFERYLREELGLVFPPCNPQGETV